MENRVPYLRSESFEVANFPVICRATCSLPGGHRSRVDTDFSLRFTAFPCEKRQSNLRIWSWICKNVKLHCCLSQFLLKLARKIEIWVFCGKFTVLCALSEASILLKISNWILECIYSTLKGILLLNNQRVALIQSEIYASTSYSLEHDEIFPSKPQNLIFLSGITKKVKGFF